MTTISIITAVRNGAGTIRNCIQSVSGQSYPSEHIIVDGGSTDETPAIIGEFRSAVARHISEPDQGIYDAMNKGIRLAAGDVIGILNADDIYAHSGVLAEVARVFEDKQVDACYGDLNYVDSTDTSRIVRSWRSGAFTQKSFYRGWMPPHPTFFVRGKIYEKYGDFKLDMGSAADYELMLRFLLRYRIPTVYIPEVLVLMRTGGVSNASFANRIKANRMDREAWRVNGIKPRPWTLWMKPLRKIHQYFVEHRKS